ncbi:glycosyltransferase family 4 protein [Erythrobacter sp. MTPC3]|uniref:glycosyltransferase family 4 protein n=1 Tax=Erythrobacter sp. MTPC3 TaxID=3056564 RepID=UPI0036F2D430
MNAVDLSVPVSQDASKDVPQRKTICYPFAGDSIGGSHISLLGLLENLDPGRFRILIVPEIPDGKIARHFGAFEQLSDPARPSTSFTPDEAFNPRKYLKTLAGLPKRIRFLRENGIDLVHSNDGRTHATWSLAARAAGLPLVWHHRADPAALGLRFLAPALASRVLTVSSFSLPKGKIWSAADKSQVVFSPFDTSITVDRDKARAMVLSAADLPADALILGYIGSFVPRKRPLLFVDAIKELRARLNRPVFGLMFGEAVVPEMEQKLRGHIAASGVEDCVKLMGLRTPGHEWIGGCDQLLVPAISEPLGRTLVEAMLVGTPVVATSSGGNPEALAGHTGHLVEPESAAALASGAELLLNNPAETEQMVKRAAVSARDRFGIQRHTQSVTQVYETLLD